MTLYRLTAAAPLLLACSFVIIHSDPAVFNSYCRSFSERRQMRARESQQGHGQTEGGIGVGSQLQAELEGERDSGCAERKLTQEQAHAKRRMRGWHGA